MNKGIIILITVLIVVALLLVIFGFNYIDKIGNRYVINYNFTAISSGLNADYQYFLPYQDRHVYVALKQVKIDNYYYYLSYYDVTLFSTMEKYLEDKFTNIPNDGDTYGYLSHFNLCLPIVKQYLDNNVFDLNMFYSFNDVYIIFDENSVRFNFNLDYYKYWGLVTIIDSLNKFTYSYSKAAPVLDSSNILSSFNYVFVDYPNYIFGFFGNIINFIVGGSLSWSY